MKYAVVYYSMTSNNRCLAVRIAKELGCDAFEIRTTVKSVPLLLLFSVMRISPGIKRPSFSVKDCDCLVMCGPIWMGMLISPMRAFAMKYGNDIRRVCFATCCGSGDAVKDNSFGYEKVFGYLRTLMREKLALCVAFPVELVHPGGEPPDKEAAMKTRLTDEDFRGYMKKRLDEFIAGVKTIER